MSCLEKKNNKQGKSSIQARGNQVPIIPRVLVICQSNRRLSLRFSLSIQSTDQRIKEAGRTKALNRMFYYYGIYLCLNDKAEQGDCITWAFRVDKFLRGCELASDLCAVTAELIREIYSRFSILSCRDFRRYEQKSLPAIFNSAEI